MVGIAMADSFSLRQSLEEGSTILHLVGEITADAEEQLIGSYAQLNPTDSQRVILDFADTRYINSSGIAILIQLINRAQDDGRTIEFATLSDHLRKIMDVVGLTEFVHIFRDLNEALS